MSHLGMSFWVKRLKWEEFRELYHRYAEELGKKLGKRVCVNEEILKTEYDIYNDTGLPYCVCAKNWVKETICPCVMALPGLKYYNECWCGLFYLCGGGGENDREEGDRGNN